MGSKRLTGTHQVTQVEMKLERKCEHRWNALSKAVCSLILRWSKKGGSGKQRKRKCNTKENAKMTHKNIQGYTHRKRDRDWKIGYGPMERTMERKRRCKKHKKKRKELKVETKSTTQQKSVEFICGEHAGKRVRIRI